MSGFFGFLTFAAAICFIIGLIKPGALVFWSKKKSRGMSSIVYGAAFVVFLIIACVSASPKASAPAATTADSKSSQTSTVSKSSSSKAEASSTAPKTISVNQTLTDGYYTIGTDIPAGTYNFTATGNSGNVIASNGSINEIMGDSGDKTYSNAKLTNGQVLSISGVTLQITSNNASGNTLKPRNQSGLSEKQLAAGNYTAGTDFPAGVYDLKAVSGQGNVICENGSLPLNTIMGTDNSDGMATKTYKNVSFKSGNVLKITGVTISITPSK